MNPYAISFTRIIQQAIQLLKSLDFRGTVSYRTGQCLIPFYIFHQLVMAASGYFIVQWNVSVLLKVFLLLAICFVSFFLLHRLLIKWMLLPRLLLSLRARQRQGSKGKA